MPKIVAIEPCI